MTSEFKWRAGDVQLFPSKTWLWKLVVKYHHVALYFCETKYGLPLIIESIGRGVLIRSLYSYTGETVRVMRPQVTDDVAQKVAKAAEKLADNPGSWYGYFDIPRYVLPKLILAKFGSWLPQKWSLVIKMLAYSYKANHVYLCSELVCEAYRAAGLPLVNESTIPLPDDIAGSDKLQSLGDITIPEKT